MQSEFVDRLLTCVDCHGQFVFTAGEQIFFLDKQFKNDPKRCKPCKCKRAALGARAGGAPVAAGIARTETRTECSECHIETTVPFKPTQGRPVLCRQCFQTKRAQTSTAAEMIAATAGLDLQAPSVEAVNAALQRPQA
jgi:CxxC-x17-CxxC domain-containing protein